MLVEGEGTEIREKFLWGRLSGMGAFLERINQDY